MKIFYSTKNYATEKPCIGLTCGSDEHHNVRVIRFLRRVQSTDTEPEAKKMWKEAETMQMSAFEMNEYSLDRTLNTGEARFESSTSYFPARTMNEAMGICGVCINPWRLIGGYYSLTGEKLRLLMRHLIAFGLLGDPISLDERRKLGTSEEAWVDIHVTQVKKYVSSLKDKEDELSRSLEAAERSLNKLNVKIPSKFDQKEENTMEKTNIKIDVVVASLKKDSEITKVIADEARRTTVVKFDDGGVEVVKCSKDDDYDVYVGVALAKARHAAGSTTAFHKAVDDVLVVVKPKKAKHNPKVPVGPTVPGQEPKYPIGKKAAATKSHSRGSKGKKGTGTK